MSTALDLGMSRWAEHHSVSEDRGVMEKGGTNWVFPNCRWQEPGDCSKIPTGQWSFCKGWIQTHGCIKPKLGRVGEEETGLAIAGRGFKVSVGERAVQEQSPWGERRDWVPPSAQDELGHGRSRLSVCCCICVVCLLCLELPWVFMSSLLFLLQGHSPCLGHHPLGLEHLGLASWNLLFSYLSCCYPKLCWVLWVLQDSFHGLELVPFILHLSVLRCWCQA